MHGPMKTRCEPLNGRSGVALVTVLCLVVLMSGVGAFFLHASLSHRRIARAQLGMNKALYAAEAGLHRAAAYIADEGSIPHSFTGTIGDGSYAVSIVEGALLVDSADTLASAIRAEMRVNPGGGGHSFLLKQAGGGELTWDDLRDRSSNWSGQATLVRLKPIGSDNSMLVNDEPQTVSNANTYIVESDVMSVILYNDHFNPRGRAVGQWWIAIAAAEATITIE